MISTHKTNTYIPVRKTKALKKLNENTNKYFCLSFFNETPIGLYLFNNVAFQVEP